MGFEQRNRNPVSNQMNHLDLLITLSPSVHFHLNIPISMIVSILVLLNVSSVVSAMMMHTEVSLFFISSTFEVELTISDKPSSPEYSYSHSQLFGE